MPRQLILPKTNSKPVRFLFPLLFFLLGCSCVGWAVPETAPPAVPGHAQPLKLRMPDPAKLKALQEDKAFHYQQDLKPDLSAWERFWQRVGRYLNNVTAARSFNVFWKYFLYAFALGVTVFVVLKLLQVDLVGLFGRKAVPVALAYDTYRENIHEIDFAALIEEAEAQGDYRRAIRLHYLQTLKRLTDQGFIHWKPGKTNRSYVTEIRDHALRQSFAHVTGLFEYVWYGGSALDEAHFQTVRASFLTFTHTLRATA